MGTVIVRYRVKPERADENIALIKAVIAEVNEKQPGGLRYAAFVAEDGVTFFHTAFIDAEKNPLLALGTFEAFLKDIADRCDQPPQAIAVEEVGSYRLHTA